MQWETNQWCENEIWTDRTTLELCSNKYGCPVLYNFWMVSIFFHMILKPNHIMSLTQKKNFQNLPEQSLWNIEVWQTADIEK